MHPRWGTDTRNPLVYSWEQITKLQAEIPADDLLYLAGGL